MSEIIQADFQREDGLFSVGDLPQAGSVASIAFGSGWWELDEIFKFYLGQFVVITGIAGHGKSTFLINLLINIARLHGVGSFLYAPENERHLRTKLRSIWPGDDESFDHFIFTQCHVQSSSPHYYQDEPHTLDWVLDKAAKSIRKYKSEVIVIDPWNELEYAKPRDMNMTDHIGQSLMMLKQFMRALGVIVVVVAHPTKAVFDRGNARTPGLADIEGSMNWYNKCDNGLIVFREGSTAKVISAKVREDGAGRIGCCYFSVDPKSGIFTPVHGGVDVA